MIDNNGRRLPIPGFPEYEISAGGNIYSHWTREDTGKWHVDRHYTKKLKDRLNPQGYRIASLQNRKGQSITKKVAALVLLTFVGPRPKNMNVCHNDGIRTNDSLSNLRYDTQKANILDARKDNKMSELSPLDIIEIRQRREDGETYRSIAEDFPVKSSAIGSVCRGRTHKHIP